MLPRADFCDSLLCLYRMCKVPISKLVSSHNLYDSDCKADLPAALSTLSRTKLVLLARDDVTSIAQSFRDVFEFACWDSVPDQPCRGLREMMRANDLIIPHCSSAADDSFSERLLPSKLYYLTARLINCCLKVAGLEREMHLPLYSLRSQRRTRLTHADPSASGKF